MPVSTAEFTCVPSVFGWSPGYPLKLERYVKGLGLRSPVIELANFIVGNGGQIVDFPCFSICVATGGYLAGGVAG